jgi:eukaryotic-like serine/threonine-protein kinase
MLDSPPVKVKEIPQFHILALSIAESGDVAVILRQSWLAVNVGSLRSPGPGLDDVRRLSLDDGVAYPHAWTPDSASVLYESNRSGHFQIYKQRLDRHDPDPIVTTASPQMLPRMSPDHRWILFANDELDHSSSALFRVSSQGGTPLPVAAGLGADYRCPQEGTTCVIRTHDAHGRAVYSALDPVSGRGRQLFLAPEDWDRPGDWDISPDGSTLAAIFPQSPTPLVRTVAISSGSTQTIPLHDAAPIMSINWAADGKGWFVAATTLAEGDIYYVDLHGAATLLRHTAGPTWAVPSPDGHKLAFVDQSVDSNVWLVHPNRDK